MSHERTDEIRIVVAFGDIRGFTDTCERVTSPKLEIAPFFDKFDAIIAKYAKATGFTFDDTGDGFMCIVELGAGHNCEKAIRLLGAVWRLIYEVNRAIFEMQPPKFRGFRVRVAAGYILRKVKRDGQIVYRGKPINLAHNTLEIAKDELVVAHESFVELMNPNQIKKAGFCVNRLPRPKRRPESVSHKDAGMLHIFTPDAL